MTTVVISQPMLFPWPGFFEQFACADVFIHLDDAQFSKGSFTNRIQLNFPNGRRWMTIPLEKKGSFQAIGELRASRPDWKDEHRQLLENSLQHSQHVEDALKLFELTYSKEKVVDILTDSIENIADYLGISMPHTIVRSSDLNVSGKSWQRVLNMVKKFNGTRYLTGHGASRYLDHEAFEQSKIDVEYMRYSLTPWPQPNCVFSPYVSVLDLIANTGPSSDTFLKPAKENWRDFVARRAET